MLRDSGRAVSEEFGYHFQAYSPVQAPGSIGVSGDVGEDRLVYPAVVICVVPVKKDDRFI